MKPPVRAPQLLDLLRKGVEVERILRARLGPEVDGRYEHWDRLRHLTPPAGLTHEEWWTGIQLARRAPARQLPIYDKDGQPFVLTVTNTMLRELNFLDREAARNILGANPDDETAIRRRQLVRSMIEEAMTSSQLEGASTSRQAAKEMLRSGRSPNNRSEQMIFNSFAAMQSLNGLRDCPLTPDMIIEIHRRLMLDAVDDPRDAGRLRSTADDIVLQDTDPEVTLHIPPSAAELPRRLALLCDFANGADLGEFLHPIIRAVAIHFQIGYDHPFCDGNGRTARTLFYWSLLRSGYTLSEYVSISSVIAKAPSRYLRAYLHTESDGGDIGYFVAHQLNVMCKAVDNVRRYIEDHERSQQAPAPGQPDVLERAKY